ncbi:nucleotidyltransferase family protein [Methylobacterium persicinum]|uniref:Molybdenum cofactor cytidylyltransferase n=1 Tax=Methylobacterium persicinum TaxID=374426 RepID=A0ABU0HR40_9HYPH|nr:nucleotidyltransferase family protein [Methylobacterium persicinum]MDQ0443951.1 molybdenum cofactor cytidylyltransferase [Methylobacterium persicinum]GJE38500.1 Molybdenum cofactor cytidylyltransferase [Methylobacterium persicinum]
MTDVATLILAAGRGTRFGAAPKLLALLDGKPLVRRAAEAALAARPRPVVAVLGAHADPVEAALVGLNLRLVRNEAYADGLSTSLKKGISALPPGCEAAIVMLGDMPLVSADLIDCLADAFVRAGSKPAAVIPVHAGRRGNPILLNLRLLGEDIAGLQGDRGAGPLLSGRTDLLEVEGDASTTLDIDTPEALAELTTPRM